MHERNLLPALGASKMLHEDFLQAENEKKNFWFKKSLKRDHPSKIETFIRIVTKSQKKLLPALFFSLGKCSNLI